MKYVIRFKDGGYYSTLEGWGWSSAPRIHAHVFDTMKAARKQLNRLNGRLVKDWGAEIEPA
jgi:hypothetical protein